MKKDLKIFGIAVLVILIGLIFLYKSLSMSIPEGEAGDVADELAQKMLSSLNYEGYKDLKQISWTYRGKTRYVWNKKGRTVLVKNSEGEVLLNFRNGEHQVMMNSDSVDFDQVIASFYNDSFWLVAPFKIMDRGVERKYVATDDGPGLLVTYKSGGVTPGDSYLWVLDENYRPKYWRIWTSNVRIKGMKLEWKKWKQYKGVWFASDHKAQIPVNIRTGDIEVD